MKKASHLKNLLVMHDLELVEWKNIDRLSYSNINEIAQGIIEGYLNCETHVEQGNMKYVIEIYKISGKIDVNVLTRREYKQAYGYDYDNK